MNANPWRIAAAFLAIAAPVTAADDGRPWRVIVRGIDRDLGETPLVVALDKAPPIGAYSLARAGEDVEIPAAVFEEGGRRSLAFIAGRIEKGAALEYRLLPREGDGIGPKGVTIAPEGEKPGIGLAFSVDGKPFTTYRTDLGPKPILFPLIGPTGATMTRAFPMEPVEGEAKDHPHQRSFWFTHGKVNGVDFWSELPGHGRIRETYRQAREGLAMGGLRSLDQWVGPDGKVVCEDHRTLRVYAVKSARILDFDVTIKATEGPVTFGDTKEGMFGLRVASALDVSRKDGGGGTITNAEGLRNAEAWGKASPWVDYAGKIDGKAVGVAILNHPESFRYPTTWHVREYGLFAANPFGWKDFGRAESGEYTLPAGESVTFRYRVILHEGDTRAADIASAFAAYATPPTVEVRGD